MQNSSSLAGISLQSNVQRSIYYVRAESIKRTVAILLDVDYVKYIQLTGCCYRKHRKRRSASSAFGGATYAYAELSEYNL